MEEVKVGVVVASVAAVAGVAGRRRARARTTGSGRRSELRIGSIVRPRVWTWGVRDRAVSVSDPHGRIRTYVRSGGIVSGLRSALEELRAEDLSWVPDSRLEDDFVEIHTSWLALDAERLRRLSEIDRRK